MGLHSGGGLGHRDGMVTDSKTVSHAGTGSGGDGVRVERGGSGTASGVVLVGRVCDDFRMSVLERLFRESVGIGFTGGDGCGESCAAVCEFSCVGSHRWRKGLEV